MITHAEAQALLSERLDAPLDPYVNDILEAHLATCDECRAFAESSAYLASSLRTMPFMPVSAAVRQNVWAAIEQQQHSGWHRFIAALTGQTAAVVPTAAVALIVIAFASVAILRLVDTGDGDDDNEARLAAGTRENIALATENAEPTEPDVATEQQAEPTTIPPSLTPTEPVSSADESGIASTSGAATRPSEPTATSQPSAVPTDTPAATEPPVETEAPSTAPPTETQVPPTEPEAAARFAPTSEADEAPTDLTGRGGAVSSPGSESAVENLEVLDPAGLLATVESTLDTPVPSPTVTMEPATETPVPATDTPEPSPTATTEPATETPVPATDTPEPSPTATTEPSPTATAMPPTETPTPIPTATASPTEIPATETREPTSEAPPPIEPIEGSTVIDTSGSEATSTPSTSEPGDNGDDNDSSDTIEQIIEATGRGEPSDDGENNASESESNATESDGTDSPVIGPPDGPDSDEGRIESTTDDSGSSGEATVETRDNETPATNDTGTGSTGDFDLSEAPFYSDGELWGPADARLGYDDGVIFSPNPDGYGLRRDDVELQSVSDDGGVSLAICTNGDCTDATSDSADGPHTDEPIGWVDGRLLYQRTSPGQPVALRAVAWNGSPGADTQLGTIDAPVSPLGAAYPVDGGTLVPTASVWLLITDARAEVVDENPYGEVRLVRTNYGDEALITYVANGQVVIASTATPGTPTSTIPFSGVDYDLSTRAQAVAISTGSGIAIYDLGGSRIAASDTAIQTGSLLWLQDGIVFIDQTTNAIRLVDPAALGL